MSTAASEATRLERTLSKTTAAALAVSRNDGDDVFGELAASLARILEVDATMIARFDRDVPRRVISLATWLDGRLQRPFDYDIEGTPCRAMVGRESRFVAAGVHGEFTPGTLFHAQRFDSYAAHAMCDASGKQVGLIVALHRGPLHDQALTEALLKIFAVRAAAELERQRADALARASEASYRSIFEAAEDAIFVHDVDTGRVLDVNPQACRSYGYTHDELLAVRIADVSSNVPPFTEAEAARHLEQARSGKPVRFEWHRRNKDGSLHWDEVVLKRATIGGKERILAFTREITDRKADHEALRLREEQYRAIFDGSADALVLWSRDIRIVDVNSAFTSMYGYTREEIVGSTFGDRLPTLDVARRIKLMQRALEGETGHLETRTIRKSGEAFDVEIRYVPIRHRGEAHVLAVARDITERRSVEAALRASEEQYRAIFNASADALVLWDSQYRRVDVNLAYQRMYGWEREEVIGRGYEHPRFSPEYARPRVELVRRALAGESCRAELEAIRRDGTRVLTEVQAIPFRHRGEPHVLAIARDITERKRAEQALLDSEEQYRAIFNASADALVLRDADFRIVDVNATYEEMSDYPRDMVIGADRVFANPPADAEAIRALHARALAGEQIVFETTLVRRDGTRYDLELRGVPIQHRGAPHVLYMGRDVTARTQADARRRELESQLQQAQKMEAIGHLTGGIAHDFNNILTSVMGYIALASERPAGAADPKLQAYLNQADQSCHRARDLIQQMLAFSRGQRGEPRPVALRSLVNESTRMLRATLPATLELAHRVEGDPVARVDPVQAHQVLLNLCINARDAMSESGRITVTARRVRVAEMTCASCRHRFSGEYAELAVADGGSGIPPEVLERMFDPFFSTKEIGQGTGMGLSIVHGVVHDHGGHVLVESGRDAGTTFRVLLPLAGEGASETGAAPDAAVRQGASLHGRILLVEDEQSVLGFMRELLQGWGLEVVAARDPRDALHWFSLEPDRFDVVLTDHTMPGMTGMELTRALVARRAGLPVLLYSGRNDLLDSSTATAAGVRTLLAKPVDKAALRAALQDALPATST
jgi:PAS domain S-box-containing protein